jgi:tripartite ATP-independent transporter DctP family solute receptor
MIKPRIARRALLTLCLGALLPVAAHAQNIKERTIRVGILLPMDHPVGVGAKAFADQVGERSGGKLKVRVFSNAQLGNENQQLGALQGGVQEVFIPATTSLANIVKEFGLFDFPFLFNNVQEADALLDGPVGRKFLDRLPPKGLVGLAYWENGFRNITSTKKPVNKLEDIAGQKIRVMQNPVFLDMFNTLGASAVPLPFPELFTALETRTVDGQENPFGVIAASRFSEVQKYLSLTRHSYSPFILLVGKKFWDGLSPAEKDILSTSALQAGKLQRETSRAQDEKLKGDLIKAGMQVNEVDPREISRMRDRLQPVVQRYSVQYGADIMGEVQAELASIRKGQPAPR